MSHGHNGTVFRVLLPKISTSQKRIAPTGWHGWHVFATLLVQSSGFWSFTIKMTSWGWRWICEAFKGGPQNTFLFWSLLPLSPIIVIIIAMIIIMITICIIIITRPKPAYGRQGLAGRSLRASAAQLGSGKWWFFVTAHKHCIIIYIIIIIIIIKLESVLQVFQ